MSEYIKSLDNEYYKNLELDLHSILNDSYVINDENYKELSVYKHLCEMIDSNNKELLKIFNSWAKDFNLIKEKISNLSLEYRKRISDGFGKLTSYACIYAYRKKNEKDAE